MPRLPQAAAAPSLSTAAGEALAHGPARRRSHPLSPPGRVIAVVGTGCWARSRQRLPLDCEQTHTSLAYVHGREPTRLIGPICHLRHGDDGPPQRGETWATCCCQVVCHAQIASEAGSLTTWGRFARSISAKLIRRPSHCVRKAPVAAARGPAVGAPAGRRSGRRGGQRQGKANPRPKAATASPPLSDRARPAKVRGQPAPGLGAMTISKKGPPPPASSDDLGGVWERSAGGAGELSEAVARRATGPTPRRNSATVLYPGERWPAVCCASTPEAGLAGTPTSEFLGSLSPASKPPWAVDLGGRNIANWKDNVGAAKPQIRG